MFSVTHCIIQPTAPFPRLVAGVSVEKAICRDIFGSSSAPGRGCSECRTICTNLDEQNERRAFPHRTPDSCSFVAHAGKFGRHYMPCSAIEVDGEGIAPLLGDDAPGLPQAQSSARRTRRPYIHGIAASVFREGTVAHRNSSTGNRTGGGRGDRKCPVCTHGSSTYAARVHRSQARHTARNCCSAAHDHRDEAAGARYRGSLTPQYTWRSGSAGVREGKLASRRIRCRRCGAARGHNTTHCRSHGIASLCGHGRTASGCNQRTPGKACVASRECTRSTQDAS